MRFNHFRLPKPVKTSSKGTKDIWNPSLKWALKIPKIRFRGNPHWRRVSDDGESCRSAWHSVDDQWSGVWKSWCRTARSYWNTDIFREIVIVQKSRILTNGIDDINFCNTLYISQNAQLRITAPWNCCYANRNLPFLKLPECMYFPFFDLTIVFMWKYIMFIWKSSEEYHKLQLFWKE